MECLMVEGGPGGSMYFSGVYTDNGRDTNCNSPTNRIIENPIVVVGGSTHDTVIPFSAVYDRVDVNVVSLNAISVTV